MVIIHCDDNDDACEIKLREGGSFDLDYNHATGSPSKHTRRASTGMASFLSVEARDQIPPILRSFSSDYRNQETDSENVGRFLSELGDPKDCKKLTIVQHGARYRYNTNDFFRVSNPFPISALTNVVKRARRLVCLELYRIRLEGSLEDFADFARAIESLPYLQAFSLEYCRVNNKKVAKQSPLDPVVRALMSCLCILDITLIADKPLSLGTLSIDTVGFLGRSPSLQILRLERLDLEDSHTAELSRALEANVLLHTLKLHCSISDPGSCAIVQMLERNNTIHTFDLFLETIENEEAAYRIGGAFQASASLKHYHLDFGSKNLSSRLKQVQDEVIETKALVKELEFSSTRLSNCPFIRLLNGAIDASMYFGGLACGPTGQL